MNDFVYLKPEAEKYHEKKKATEDFLQVRKESIPIKPFGENT